MDRFTELQVFVAIADVQNMTRAAETLSMSVSAVSRSLSGLEERLNVRLVQRTTRQLSLTSEGERFAQCAREILANLDEAENQASRGTAEPHGTLRVGASLSFALLHLLPVIRDFKRDYPKVRVEVEASNRYYDIVENNLDLAVRNRLAEADSSVTIRRLAEVPRLLAAAPDYLARHGTPSQPEDLAAHQMLLYTLAADGNAMALTNQTETRRITPEADMICNDGQLIRRAALDGMGILIQPAYIIHDDLAAGRLVRVLPDWSLPHLVMNIAYPSRSFLPVRTRLFIDALVRHFRDNDLPGKWHSGA